MSSKLDRWCLLATPVGSCWPILQLARGTAKQAQRGSIPSLKKFTNTPRISSEPSTEEVRPNEIQNVPCQDSQVPSGSEVSSFACDQFLPYRFHRLADLFPLMQGTEFDLFKEDVRRNGLLEPILLYEGAVLDGRNRLRACIEAGVPIRTVELVGSDPLSSVISANLSRRHLTTRERAEAAARLSNLPVGRPGENTPNGGISQADAAKLFNVSLRSVQRAATARRCANPEPIEKVVNGKTSVLAAACVVKQSAESQNGNTIKPPGSAKKARAVRESARLPQPAKKTGDQSSQIEMPVVGLFGSDPLPKSVKDKKEINEGAKCAKRADREQARENSRQFAQLLIDQIDPSQWPQVIAWLGHCNPDDVVAFMQQRQMP
jgi:ParB-like chromosome segregation protein Spo0J